MFGRFGGGGGHFVAQYRCYPVTFIDRPQLENGDKVILPPSALDRLTQMMIEEFPMLFEVTNTKHKKTTHCGVLEFVAEEGVVYLPYWMMQNLLLAEGDIVKFQYAKLLKGQYVKLRPQTQDFLDISNPKVKQIPRPKPVQLPNPQPQTLNPKPLNTKPLNPKPLNPKPLNPKTSWTSLNPKAVLETTLRTYTCLTVGDSILINYNNKRYYVDIVEARPNSAVCIVDTDCEVDFAPPLDYVEPVYDKPKPAGSKSGGDGGGERPSAGGSGGAGPGTEGAGAGAGKEPEDTAAADTGPKFLAFAGGGNRLDGKSQRDLAPVEVALPTTSLNIPKEFEQFMRGPKPEEGGEKKK
eukprot:CAMPEP_0198706864 /NCGR_PEP_ID=MMETSP1468-20131203/391088_1 /TAXON_ID=1461545 /ORGANISM="Mantoniella sp, Strain CCMP1436" /LENGTH=351 /DNA_ID=CAMNT_0044465819 /DNA_START=1321 /DNA_END=2368 /DNA_ORIENTATION=+